MCGRYELLTEFEQLQPILKRNTPQDFEKNYSKQQLITPNNPVIVLKDEGKISTSLMLWGFISEWTKDPFNSSKPKPFNARSETVRENNLFKRSWQHKRCVLPASGFFEKGNWIGRKDSHPFWLAGIWSRWMGHEGSEIETCCVLTTEPNKLIKPIHKRMPVIITNGLEENWIYPAKNQSQLREIAKMMDGWCPEEWISKPMQPPKSSQMSLF